jgi:hypothetical protein
MYDMSNVRPGFTVYSFDGEKVGTIGEVGATHFKCDTGFLRLGKDFYIPFSSIHRVEGDRLYLNVSNDQLNSTMWDRQPASWAR